MGRWCNSRGPPDSLHWVCRWVGALPNTCTRTLCILTSAHPQRVLNPGGLTGIIIGNAGCETARGWRTANGRIQRYELTTDDLLTMKWTLTIILLNWTIPLRTYWLRLNRTFNQWLWTPSLNSTWLWPFKIDFTEHGLWFDYFCDSLLWTYCLLLSSLCPISTIHISILTLLVLGMQPMSLLHRVHAKVITVPGQCQTWTEHKTTDPNRQRCHAGLVISNQEQIFNPQSTRSNLKRTVRAKL